MVVGIEDDGEVNITDTPTVDANISTVIRYSNCPLTTSLQDINEKISQCLEEVRNSCYQNPLRCPCRQDQEMYYLCQKSSVVLVSKI